MSITIYAGAQLDGCKIKDFPWPTDCIVMVIYRGEEKSFRMANKAASGRYINFTC